ncbi:MAG: RNA polymerase sigma factor [Mangrovibacterium sp.]
MNQEKINWNEVYQTNAPLLIAVCRRYVKDASIAEDLVQESFIKAINKINDFNGSGDIAAWLRRIVINDALMYLRKNNQNLIDEVTQLPDIHDEEEIYHYHFSLDELLNAIDSLPTNHRTVFNLYVLDGYKHKQIAEMLQMSENTSKSHLMRARVILQAKLETMANDKKKKQKLATIIFGSSTSPIDKIFQKELFDYRIQPSKNFIPKISNLPKSSIFKYSSSLKLISGIGASICITSIFYFSIKDDLLIHSEELSESMGVTSLHTTNSISPLKTDSICNYLDIIDNTQKLKINQQQQKKTPLAATFSKKHIIDSDNNNYVENILTQKQEMNFLKSLGVALIATQIYSSNALAQAGSGYSKSQIVEKTSKNNTQINDSTTSVDSKKKSSIEDAKYSAKAQVSFMYPIGSAGTQSPETAFDFSFNILSGITHSSNGFELAGLSNMNKGHMKGFQLAGLVNQTSGHTNGMQIAGIYNYSGEYLNGMQLAGMFNYTNSDVNGMQLSGIMNYNGENLKGMQLALVNYTRSNRGFQLGLINIADSIGEKNAALGLINIFKHGGYREIEVFSSDYMLVGANFKLGSKRLYTIFSLGYQNTAQSYYSHDENSISNLIVNDGLLAIGAGIGTILEVSPKFWIQPEAYTYTYNAWGEKMYSDQTIQSHRMKIAFRYNINSKFAFSLAPSAACNLYKINSAEISHFKPSHTFENNHNPTIDIVIGASFGLIYCW